LAKSSSKSGGRKERITPPKTRLLSREGAKLRQGDPAAARILAEEICRSSPGCAKEQAEAVEILSYGRVICPEAA
jgi:hypothetical protein